MRKNSKIVLLVVITTFISVISTMYLVDTSETPSSYNIHEIDSKILLENRELIVKLPSDYELNSDKVYPVIYVFGGNTLTYSIAYDTDLLVRTGHLESAIIVGISNISQETRQRDLTPPFMKQDIDETDSPLGKADNHLDFVQKEVIDFIERTYRTSSTRIAVGHSREGLMVMYSLISKTDLFQGHTALSPALWRENNLFIDNFKKFISKTDTIKSYLFLSMGDQEVNKMKNAFNSTIEFLSTDSISKKIKWNSLYTKGATHNNNALLSAPIGIETILKNN
ncbi:MAG: alpha/beta hydrolase [Flavobacteriaceae bacterium]|nr:alpha/beta hydrolase [Flavobacteriaceae bacterium]